MIVPDPPAEIGEVFTDPKSHAALEMGWLTDPPLELVTVRVCCSVLPFTADVKVSELGETVRPVEVPPLTVRLTVIVVELPKESVTVILPI